MKITTKAELKKLAKYLLNKYFYGIPLVNISFLPKNRFGKTELGRMCITENDDYDESEDDLLNEPEYQGVDIDLPEGIVYHYNKEPSWSDPLNHPDINIFINNECKNDPLLLFGIVLHELCHYYCWYVGYNYHDGDDDFERIIKEMDLPSNYIHTYDKRYHKWRDSNDYTKLKTYYEDYLNNKDLR